MKRIYSLAVVLCISLMPMTAFARVVPAKDMQLMTHSRRTLRQNVRAAAAVRLRDRLGLVSLPHVFESTEAGISIRYPDRWQMRHLMQKEGNLTLVLMLLSEAPPEDAVQQNINLVLEKLGDPDLTLSEFSDEGISKEAQSLYDYNLRNRGMTVVADQPAEQVIFTATSMGVEMMFKQVWFLQDGTAHVWTFADETSHFAGHVGVFDAILASLIIH